MLDIKYIRAKYEQLRSTVIKSDDIFSDISRLCHCNKHVARNSQWGGLFWGSGGGTPAIENFAFFAKITILELFQKK